MNNQIPPWGKIALQHFGVREFPGLDKNNPIIVEFIRLATKGKNLPDETSWCPAFACACVLDSGIKPVYGLVAKGWKGWGRKLEKPVDFCLVILDSPNPNAESWQGHICFWLSPEFAFKLMEELGVPTLTYDTNKYFIGFGGNQNNGVGFNLYSYSLVEDYLWPVEYINFTDMTLSIRTRVNDYVNVKMDTLALPAGSITPNQVLVDIENNKTQLNLYKFWYSIVGWLKGVGWLAVGVLQSIPSAATKATGKGIGLLLDQAQGKETIVTKSTITELIEKIIEFIKMLIDKIKGVKTK